MLEPIHMLKLYRSKYTHIQRSSSKTGGIRVRSLSCISVPILVVILRYHFAICYHRGNWVKSTGNVSVLFHTTALETTIISK